MHTGRTGAYSPSLAQKHLSGTSVSLNPAYNKNPGTAASLHSHTGRGSTSLPGCFRKYPFIRPVCPVYHVLADRIIVCGMDKVNGQAAFLRCLGKYTVPRRPASAAGCQIIMCHIAVFVVVPVCDRSVPGLWICPEQKGVAWNIRFQEQNY